MAITADDCEILDNPVWFALNGEQAWLGEGGVLARRFRPDVSPFAGLESMSEAAFEALGELLPDGQSAVLVTRAEVGAAEGVRTDYLFDVLQMVDSVDGSGEVETEAVPLSQADAGDMVALVDRTKPGPFGLRTCDMGDYIGIRRDGRLVAMAGERMKVGRFVEISAVCVDEALRGRGIASRLMNTLRRNIRRGGRVPILHVRRDAAATVRLYENLGFSARAAFSLHQVASGTQGQAPVQTG